LKTKENRKFLRIKRTLPPVLESQLFFWIGFWIGWMIEHPTKTISPNVQKSWTFGFLLNFCWIFRLD
jgi:hypothetical protein